MQSGSSSVFDSDGGVARDAWTSATSLGSNAPATLLISAATAGDAGSCV
jgi:hypothetical protein